MDLVCALADEPELTAYADLFRLVRAPAAEGFFLAYADGLLRLCRGADSKGIWVETSEIRRRLAGDFLLGRACGTSRGTALSVLDATAGLGVDGLALALTGQRVRLVEREPALWALTHNLIARLDLSAPAPELVLADCRDVLAQSERYDVVCFDPMFPARAKTALPGKRMQYLVELLGPGDAFDPDLIELAVHRARSRVVLKRRLKDAPLRDPDWSIRGRAVRYDVYRGRAGQPSRRIA